MTDEKDIDEITGVDTTGHEWDGIKELNNPLPRWWLWSYYACIIFSVGYVVVYPAIPLINTATVGTFGWSSRAVLDEEMAAAQEANKDKVEAIRAMEVAEILENPELRNFAISAGNAAFKVNCVQCHGSGAAGSPGYPNLNDDSWIWGGTPEDIHITIQHGIRFEGDDDTRWTEMPAFGADEILERSEITEIASYVLTLTGQGTATDAGRELFVDNCADCHGEAGEGVVELGAPRLNDAIWHYGSTQAEIVAQISKPRMGVMPAWSARLSDETVKELAVFVHSLGGGE